MVSWGPIWVTKMSTFSSKEIHQSDEQWSLYQEDRLRPPVSDEKWSFSQDGQFGPHISHKKRALSLAKKSTRVAKNDHFLRKVGCIPEIRYLKQWKLYLSKGARPERNVFFCLNFSFSMSWDSIGLDILLHEILFLVELFPPQFWNWSNTWALARSGHFFIIVSPRGTTTEMVKLFFSELSLTLNGKTVCYDFLIYKDLILVLLCLPYHRTIIALSYWAKGD